MVKEPTIAASTFLECESEEELDFLVKYAKGFSDVKVLRQRQHASNSFELEIYCEDITDVYLFGIALGRKFPERRSEKYESEVEIEDEDY